MSKQLLSIGSGDTGGGAERTFSSGAGGAIRWLQLSSRLQTSLDPERVLRLYFDDVCRQHRIEGLRWEPVEGPVVTLGEMERCVVSYGLTVDGDTLGQLSFSRRARFAEPQFGMLEQSLGILVHPLRNAILHRRALLDARRDRLTGLGNRTAFDESLERELELARRHGSPLALLMLDVDRFKQINDSHGHTAGDAVLRQVGAVLCQAARQCDLIFRYAGDEFVLLLSHTDGNGALALAERVRRAIAHAPVTVQQSQHISVRVSVGVTVANAAESAASLFSRVDQALLDAKRAGRNCTSASNVA